MAIRVRPFVLNKLYCEFMSSLQCECDCSPDLAGAVREIDHNVKLNDRAHAIRYRLFYGRPQFTLSSGL